MSDSDSQIVDDSDAMPSPWYCPHCETWVGKKLDSCLNGHTRPRFPLYYDDVEFDYSLRVAWRHRIRAKLWRIRGR